MKNLANILLLCAIVISALGAVYLALAYHDYAVSACFLIATVMLVMCYWLPRKKK